MEVYLWNGLTTGGSLLNTNVHGVVDVNKMLNRMVEQMTAAIIIFGYHNMTKAYDAKYRYEMRRRCAKNGQ